MDKLSFTDNSVKTSFFKCHIDFLISIIGCDKSGVLSFMNP